VVLLYITGQIEGRRAGRGLAVRGTKILIALLVLAGCEGTYEPEQKETGRGGVISEPIPIEEMFVSEEIGEGLVRTVFETNKEQYWAPVVSTNDQHH
jgi:hypothetical protein